MTLKGSYMADYKPKPDPYRGTGRTTLQMLNAPQGAVFISSCTPAVAYDKSLALKHGRADLKVVAPTWLTNQSWRGQLFTGIVIDHAARLTTTEREQLKHAITRIRTTK